jgi:hypothetical protein
MITIKYNPSSGDSIWVKRFGSPNYFNSIHDIKIDNFGNSYVTGGKNFFNLSPDVLTIKYSPQGDTIWTVTYNGPANGIDVGYALAVDNANNIYVGGVSQYDYIVIKYSQLLELKKVSNEIPRRFELNQNYPNPFNPTTTIKYQLPIANYVKLILYDILGREVTTLVNEKQSTGTYEVEWDASNYPSGIFFYKLEASNFVDTKKMVVIK